MHRLMGIDYGSKRIGIALTNEGAHEEGSFALPHSVVQNSVEALPEIVEICTLNGVNKIIIGDSKDFNGEDNKIMADINVFVGNLKKELPEVEVVLHPEFLTSLQAERLQGKNDMLDASAAAIILQSYIDTNYK